MPRSRRPGDFNALLEENAAELRRFVQYLLFGSEREHWEDWYQDAIKKLIEQKDKYDSTRPFLPWARKVVCNCILDRRRALAVRRRHEVPSPNEPDAVDPTDCTPDPAEKAGTHETKKLLHEALRQLFRTDRLGATIVRLHLWGGLTFGQIAEMIFGKSQPHLASNRYYRAIEKLRALLPPSCDPNA